MTEQTDAAGVADEIVCPCGHGIQSHTWAGCIAYVPPRIGGAGACCMRTPTEVVLASDWLAAREAAAEARGAQAERERRMDYAAVKGYELGYVEGAQAVLAAVEGLAEPCDCSNPGCSLVTFARSDIGVLTAARAAAAGAGGGGEA